MMNKEDQVPEGYKKTELGIIPEEWKISTIDSNLIEHREGAPLKPTDFAEEEFNVLPIKAIISGGKIRIR